MRYILQSQAAALPRPQIHSPVNASFLPRVFSPCKLLGGEVASLTQLAKQGIPTEKGVHRRTVWQWQMKWGCASIHAAHAGCRIQDIVAYLRRVNPQTFIVLMGILPWGLINEGGVYVWPNQYTKAIGMVNSLTQTHAQAAADPLVQYIDCSHDLFPTGQASFSP